MSAAHKVLFYPVGNGDTSQIILNDGRRILFDFNHRAHGENESSPHIDLKKRLHDELKDSKKTSIDVFAITHTDIDHISGAVDFFELWHAEKYREDGRIKIDTLWLPAVALLDRVAIDERSADFAIWKKEAWHRLIEGKGIRVFSKPAELMKRLADKLEEMHLPPNARDHLFVEAGTLVKDFSLERDGIEFFCHCPFADHEEDGSTVEHNEESLIFHVRMKIDGSVTDFLQCGDTVSELLEHVVRITQRSKNEDRLRWHLYNIPHHCSYKGLNDDEKGDRETIPKPKIKELLAYCHAGAYMVSSSFPIPSTSDAFEQIQPPHIQTRRAYESALRTNAGAKFLVTMETPNTNTPKPIEFEVTNWGLRLTSSTSNLAGIAGIASVAAPRAGVR